MTYLGLVAILFMCCCCCCSSSSVGSVTPKQFRAASLNSLSAKDNKAVRRTSEAVARIKRDTSKVMDEFQKKITEQKMDCITSMGLPTDDNIKKKLMLLKNPSKEDKCIMKCILKRMGIMDDNDEVSIITVQTIAEALSDKDKKIVPQAKIVAEKCKRSLVGADSCEIAYEMNKCLSAELQLNDLNIIY